MKYLVTILLIFAASIIFISCSDDSEPNSPDGNNISATVYYPGAAGSTFTYSVKSGGSDAGQRLVTFSESADLGGKYLKQISSFDTSSITSYFRRTDAGVYFYVDTTGLSDFIPDSLKSILTLSLDEEVIAFVQTFNTTRDWVAFKMDVNIFTIPYNVITLSSHYDGSEDVTLNLTSGSSTVKAEKVRYDLKYTIPNLTGGQPQVQTFTAYIWFTKDIGIAKLEGNETVLNALGGAGIDFADTNKVMTQSLIAYDIK